MKEKRVYFSKMVRQLIRRKRELERLEKKKKTSNEDIKIIKEGESNNN